MSIGGIGWTVSPGAMDCMTVAGMMLVVMLIVMQGGNVMYRMVGYFQMMMGQMSTVQMMMLQMRCL